MELKELDDSTLYSTELNHMMNDDIVKYLNRAQKDVHDKMNHVTQ